MEEGGLTPRLAHAVWAGYRRPPGSLVALRHGMGLAMIDQTAWQAARDDRDFLSVSFGYTAALWHFGGGRAFNWCAWGRTGEASSGLYSAMALLPLSDAGRELTLRLWLTQTLSAGNGGGNDNGRRALNAPLAMF